MTDKGTMIKSLDEIGVLAFEFRQVQRRTHKKYRINKKWAKKYGFRYDTYHKGELIARDVKLEVRSTTSGCYTSTNPYWLCQPYSNSLYNWIIHR